MRLCLLVIFAVDVKVSFDSYKNGMTGSCTSKTLITTNPGQCDQVACTCVWIDKIAHIVHCVCVFFDLLIVVILYM